MWHRMCTALADFIDSRIFMEESFWFKSQTCLKTSVDGVRVMLGRDLFGLNQNCSIFSKHKFIYKFIRSLSKPFQSCSAIAQECEPRISATRRVPQWWKRPWSDRTNLDHSNGDFEGTFKVGPVNSASSHELVWKVTTI